MTTQTDLSVSPYFNDYDEAKNFYQILFRPGTSPQVREFNQLQTLLQKQIERFGNHVFKQGTIVDGCDITFHESIDFVKIRDNSIDSQKVDVNQYVGYRVRNTNDLIPLEATILTTAAGFEATTPDLNTLYLRYINSGFKTGGDPNGYTSFEPREQLVVYDPNNVIEKVTLTEEGKSQGFSPSDRVVFVSAIEVQNTTGGVFFANNFFVGDYVGDGTANAQIVAISNTAIPGSLVFTIKPTASSLRLNDSTAWTFYSNTNIQSSNTIQQSSIARVKSIVGAGAQATLQTGTLGRIDQIVVTNKGSGYVVPPTVSIASVNNTEANILQVNATPQTSIATITVADVIHSPVGSGYAVTVGEGVIYQKGFFARVDEQLVVVEKYGNGSSNPPVPNQKVIGFETREEIVTSNQDQSLLDNATGAPNFTAPGADRLKLTPKLVVYNKADADRKEDFIYVAEFASGRAFKQNRQTVYNILGNELSRRIAEESGNYVVDPFYLQTKSPVDFQQEANNFAIVIDPGKGYINGRRVETVENYEALVEKALDTQTSTNGNISVNYGNYIKVNSYRGTFGFAVGDTVTLHAIESTFVTDGSVPSAAGLGTEIGTARLRSVVFDSGVPGTPTAVYRLYLFDVRLNPGVAFARVRSIFYNGPTKGVANAVLTNGQAVLEDRRANNLVFYGGAPAIANVADVSYIYRTSNTFTLGTSGTLTVGLASGSDEFFPYTGTLNSIQERDIIIVPLANTFGSTPLTGSITCNSGSNTATIVDSLAVASEVKPGMFLYVGTSGFIQVSAVANNTHISLSQPASFSASGAAYRAGFPAYAPISLEQFSERAVVVDTPQKQLTVNLGTGLAQAVQADVAYNVRETNVQPVGKSVDRNRYVRVCTANNVGGAQGPWCLGVSDAIRLNKVYRGSNATFDTTASDITDVTNLFYIDNNHTGELADQSYLYIRPGSQLTLANSASEYLLISFDYLFSTPGAEGLKAPGGSGTYPIDDTLTLQSSVNTINTLEIPEMIGSDGSYFDLRDSFDFRPTVLGTVSPSPDPVVAPLNPSIALPATRLSSTVKKFPAPDSEVSASISYYKSRTDRVIIDETNTFRVLKGTPGENKAPEQPENSLTVQTINVPAYPSIPFVLSAETAKFADTKVANQRFSSRRLNAYRLSTNLTQRDINLAQPKRFTMQDISRLERRIADVEYYTSLTLVETLAQKRVIPGFDGLERFKFGFYVDGFEDYQFADLSDPGYRATIVDGYLMPYANETALTLSPPNDEQALLPYNTIEFVAQTRATESAATEGTTTTQTIVCVTQEERNRNNSDNGNIFEEFYYTFSATSGPVEFYINSRDNYIGAEIYQSASSNGPWQLTVTSLSALPIEQFDIDSKRLRLNGNRTIEHPGTLERASFPTGNQWGTWIEDQFKLLWTHNPASGVYYRIRIYKGGRHGGLISQGKRGTFGFQLCYPTDSTVNTPSPVNTTNYSLDYLGAIYGGGSNAWQDSGFGRFVQYK